MKTIIEKSFIESLDYSNSDCETVEIYLTGKESVVLDRIRRLEEYCGCAHDCCGHMFYHSQGLFVKHDTGNVTYLLIGRINV